MNKQSGQQFAIVLLIVVTSTGRAEAALESKQIELRANFGQLLAQLASKCDELKLDAQAKITRDWLVERGADRQYLFVPQDVDAHLPSGDASDVVKFWHRKFMQLRADHAEELFALAREVAEQGDGTTAYRLLHEVLQHDPTNADARRVLSLGSPLSTRIARRTATRNHPDFGWRRGRYWQIESQHYRITTSASAEAGVELAKKLERFHSVWQQVFFRYWSADESLAERFRGGNARLGTRKKLAVVLFADRDEYVEKLQKYESQIAISLGYYMKGEQTAFFYAGDASVEPTWYHEATHQLFQELGDSIADVGEVSNFWIVEGIAVYMESLVAHRGYMTVGGVDAERMQYARVRVLTGEFYMPLSELVRLGREELQRHEDIRRLYTQAAGMAHYLMDGANGKYRNALVDFVTMLYLGRAGPTTLASRCSIELEELDNEYAKFLIVRDEDLANLNPPTVVKSLALGRTEITDGGVKRLADFSSLQWLDLSFTQTTDAGIAHIARAIDLRRLNLEGTAIADKSLEIVSRFALLEELDLSGTKITDAGVAHLSRLKKLKVLWLTGTDVSDTGLDGLRELSHLEFLEVGQTNVTADGLAALKAKLPQLNRE
ncbi:MAG: DUF1570 domain-containing protein [Planctomycetes bacterium]|nr:DUF1570 domain-containing protein [Planctomycetota bacterium]